jgi:hypothetical protein
MTREELVEFVDDPELLFADGFDEAIIGAATRCGQPTIVVYDRDKCIDILIAEGMDPEEAEEYFCFNTEGAWVGPRTPAYVARPIDER